LSLLELMRSVEFVEVQFELFGKKKRNQLAHFVSSCTLEELVSRYRLMHDIEALQIMAHTSSDEEDQGYDVAISPLLMELKKHLVSRQQILVNFVSKYRSGDSAANQSKVGISLDEANQDMNSKGTVPQSFCNNGNNGARRYT
jgi:hypothetical protein